MAQPGNGKTVSRFDRETAREQFQSYSVEGIQQTQFRTCLSWQSKFPSALAFIVCSLGVFSLALASAGARGNLMRYRRPFAMLPTSYRISRVQKTLQWFEQDMAFLNMRVKDLSAERQRSARQFAAAVISQTRAELQRLLEEEPESALGSEENANEPLNLPREA
jgi:hypothetical protein